MQKKFYYINIYVIGTAFFFEENGGQLALNEAQ